jgi:hypothetical protein
MAFQARLTGQVGQSHQPAAVMVRITITGGPSRPVGEPPTVQVIKFGDAVGPDDLVIFGDAFLSRFLYRAPEGLSARASCIGGDPGSARPEHPLDPGKPDVKGNYVRRILVTLVALVGLMTVGLVTVPAAVAGASGGSTIYDSTTSPLSQALPSEGFEADALSQLGNQITFSTGSGRILTSAVVSLDSWACTSGTWESGCDTTTGATFAEPVTLNLYKVGADNAVGAKIASITQTFNIPYRPSADSSYTTDCASDAAAQGIPVSEFSGTWYDSADGNCYNGLATNVTFTLGHTKVPANVIYGIAYNTSDYGSAPYGDSTACHATTQGCPYDSLNFGFTTTSNEPSVGSDNVPGTVYQNSADAGNYCNDTDPGVFRIDEPATGGSSCWSTTGDGAPYYVPAVQFNAVSSDAPQISSANSKTVVVDKHFSFTITTTGVPTPVVKLIKGLPSGVTFTSHSNGTATLAGTPTKVKTWSTELRATSSTGSNTQYFALVVKS